MFTRQKPKIRMKSFSREDFFSLWKFMALYRENWRAVWGALKKRLLCKLKKQTINFSWRYTISDHHVSINYSGRYEFEIHKKTVMVHFFHPFCCYDSSMWHQALCRDSIFHLYPVFVRENWSILQQRFMICNWFGIKRALFKSGTHSHSEDSKRVKSISWKSVFVLLAKPENTFIWTWRKRAYTNIH